MTIALLISVLVFGVVLTRIAAAILIEVIHMARSIDQLRADVQALNDVTTQIGTTVADLRDKVSVDMTADEVAEVHAGLSAVTDRLTVIGADPNKVVPPANP